MRVIATGTRSGREIDINFREFLAETQLPYHPREDKSIELLASENDAEAVLVWESGRPVLIMGREKLFYHPSMAKNRLSALRHRRGSEPFLEACLLQSTDHFLDCTLGMGADAVVASYTCSKGRVVGLESVKLIAGLIRWGMRTYQSAMPWLDEAIHRVEVINSDHRDYLGNLAGNSFDVVYFDPMFRHPQHHSMAIKPLRQFADHRPLNRESIEEARRVARKRVVIKETRSSGELERLGAQFIVGSHHNPIAYGVIEK